MTEPQVAVPTPTQSASVWEDFIDIFYAPVDVYRRRVGGGFGIPMLVVAVAMAVLAFTNAGVLQPVMDAEFTRATAAVVKANPQLNAEALDKMKGFGEATQRYGTVIVIPIVLFLIGIMTWLLSKLVDSRQTLQASIMIASYAYVVRVVEQILYGVQGLLLDPSKMTSHYALQIGPARFFDPDTTSAVLMTVLGRLDLFTLWVTVLLAVGAYVAGKLTRNRAVVAGVLFWLGGSAVAILQALRQPS